jgi:flagellin
VASVSSLGENNFDNVLLNFGNAQRRFGNLVTQLSSGLRVNTAADDPSGYAIGSTLQAKSAGLAQGSRNIQDANNLLNVASGAVNRITALIDRMRTLVVEANSDINSGADKAQIQAEIDQLLLEVDRISNNTNFNGLPLLNGSQTSTPPNNVSTIVTAANPASDGTTVPSGALVYNVQVTPGVQPIAVGFYVNSYDPTTNLLTVTVNAEGAGNSGFGPAQSTTFTVTNGTAYPSFFPFPPPSYATNIVGADGKQYVSFAFNTLTPNDVGQSAVFTFTPLQDYTPSSDGGLNVNTGDGEGSTINVQIGAYDTYNLGIASLKVGDTLQNQASEALLDNALQLVTTQAAQIGAQQVALNIAQTNNDTYQTNIETSQSEILDLNVGQASTQFTQTQILVNVGQSVLAQMESADRVDTALLIQALVA